jgi:hypothetical protein
LLFCCRLPDRPPLCSGGVRLASGTFSGYRVAYLPTEHDLGVIVEIFSDDRAPERNPDAG